VALYLTFFFLNLGSWCLRKNKQERKTKKGKEIFKKNPKLQIVWDMVSCLGM